MVRRIDLVAWTFFVFAALACSRTITGVTSMTPEQRQRLAQLKIYVSDDLRGSDYRQIRPVKGVSCQTSYFYDPPSMDEALRDVSVSAAVAGANGLLNVVCEHSSMSFVHNCASLIACVGDAIVVKRLGSPPAGAPQGAPTSPSTKREAMVEQRTTGTAWLVSQGFAITNWHVVEGKKQITLHLQNGATVTSKVAARDPHNDLVLLAPDEWPVTGQALPLAQDVARLGDSVFTIGFPATDIMGQRPKLTSGVVSSLAGIQDDPRYLQISVPIQPGNSGGPLINDRGEVVAIVTAKLNYRTVLSSGGFLPENVSYAIKADYLVPLVRSLPPRQKLAELPRRPDSMSEVASRVEAAVVFVTAQ